MEESNGFTIEGIIKIIRKRIWIIVIIPILFSIVSGLLNYFYFKPVYEARVSLIVGLNENSKIKPSEINLYQSIINTFIQIGQSSAVAEKAAQKLNDGTSVGQLQGNLSIESQGGTQILIMHFRSNNPKDAVKNVQALAQAFIEEGNIMLTDGKAQIIDTAKTPGSPISPKKRRNIMLAFAAGLIIAIGIAFFMEILDNTIKDEEDVEKYLGIPVVGIIPKH